MGRPPQPRTPRRPYEPAERECLGCRRVRPIEEFYPRRGYERPVPGGRGPENRGLSGRKALCIGCEKEAGRAASRDRRLGKKTLAELRQLVITLEERIARARKVLREKTKKGKART